MFYIQWQTLHGYQNEDMFNGWYENEPWYELIFRMLVHKLTVS